MDLVTIIVATGSTIFTSVNAYFIRRQSNKLKLMKERHKFSIDETKKCIREKDDTIIDMYALYAEANTLYALIQNNIHYLHLPTQEQQLYHYKIHIQTNDIPRTYNAVCNEDDLRFATCSQQLNMCCSTNDAVYEIVDSVAKLIQCIHRIKKNRRALHTLYTSHLYQAIENVIFFMHTPTNAFVHIPLTMQHKMTNEIPKIQNTEFTFQEYLQQWVKWLLVGYAQPMVNHLKNMKSDHDYFVEWLPSHSQNNLLCNTLLSDKIDEYSTSQRVSSPALTSVHHDILSSFSNQTHINGLFQDRRTTTSPSSPPAYAGVHLIQQCKQYDAFCVSDTDTAKLFTDIYTTTSPFFPSIQRVHTILNQLCALKCTLQQNLDTFKGLIIHCLKSIICKRKRIKTSSKHKLIHTLNQLKLRYPYNTQTQTKLYILLKIKIKSATNLLKDTKTLLKQKKLDENELFDMFKPILFSCLMDIRIPSIHQFVNLLSLLIQETNDMIQKDISFRNSIIECG